MKTASISNIKTIDAETGDLNVIIETPRGSRNKYKYDPGNDLFKLDKVLTAGAMFPFDFGFFPSTLGEDGDPLDAMVLMDESIYPGTLVTVRLIGVIEADQTEKGNTIRNDRFIAVGSASQDYRYVRELEDLDQNFVAQIEHFFVSYNQMEDRVFKPIGRLNARQAGKLLEAGRERFEVKKKREA